MIYDTKVIYGCVGCAANDDDQTDPRILFGQPTVLFFLYVDQTSETQSISPYGPPFLSRLFASTPRSSTTFTRRRLLRDKGNHQ